MLNYQRVVKPFVGEQLRQRAWLPEVAFYHRQLVMFIRQYQCLKSKPSLQLPEICSFFLQLHRYFAYIYIYMYIIIKYIYNHMHIYIYTHIISYIIIYIHHHPLNMHIPQPGPSSLPWGDADPIFADREAEHSIMLGVLGNLQKVTRQRVFRHLATWITDDFWCFFWLDCPSFDIICRFGLFHHPRFFSVRISLSEIF